MERNGGLKLALQGAGRDDRMIRFAEVRLSRGDGLDERRLVTDAEGRMRYRLPDGEYRLRVGAGPQTRFWVRDHRWTAVRLRP